MVDVEVRRVIVACLHHNNIARWSRDMLVFFSIFLARENVEQMAPFRGENAGKETVAMHASHKAVYK